MVELELALVYATLVLKENAMIVEAWWRYMWYDLRLRWEPDAYAGIEMIMVAGDEVYFPEVIPWVIVSEAELRAEPHLQLYSDGKIKASIPRKDSFFCGFDLTDFPDDTQICSYEVGPWLYPQTALQVIPSDLGVDFTYHDLNSEYLLKRVEARALSVMYTCCPEPFRTIKVEFEFERLPLQYKSAVTIPLITSTYIGFLVFVLNPNAGERIGLAMTVMLTSVAVYLLVGDLMPTLGEWTQITRLYAVSSIANTYALLESAFVLLLALLAAEAAEGRDAWRSPFFMRLIDALFWYWHVNIVLRWHYNEHFVRLRKRWRNVRQRVSARVSDAQQLKRQATLRIHERGGLQAVRVAASVFDTPHSESPPRRKHSSKDQKAEVRENSIRQLKAHWEEVKNSVINKTRFAQQWLLKYGIPLRRIEQLRYAERLWDAGFETTESLELITEGDLRGVGFLNGHVRQIIRISQEAQLLGSAVSTPVIAADFTVAGWLFDAGLPHTVITTYAKSLRDEGFCNREALIGLTFDDMERLNFRPGHARILEVRQSESFHTGYLTHPSRRTELPQNLLHADG